LFQDDADVYGEVREDEEEEEESGGEEADLNVTLSAGNVRSFAYYFIDEHL
jgi:hypothetical protein